MMKRLITAAVAGVLTIAGATAQADTDAALNGTWKLYSASAAEKPYDAEQPSGLWTIDGDRLTRGNGRKFWIEIDKLKQPARLIVYNKVGNRRVNLLACIYRITGDRLDVTYNAGDTFPTEFRSKENDTGIELHFNREKPAK